VAPQLQRLAKHRPVCTEPAHPKLSAQHRDTRGASSTVLVSAEKAPDLGADAEDGKERRRDQASFDGLRLRAEPEAEAPSAVGSDGETPRVIEIGRAHV